jgi:uncharacterized LabA/DUF88 family protein
VGKNVAVFVDVANIFYAAKAAGVDIDYVTLLKSVTAGRDLVRAYAYTGLDPENENQRNFHDFLRRHGYKVVSKDIRKYGDGKVKANLDIELVVDMMKTARNLDVAVVISGDGDFAPAIRAVQETGVRVEVVSFRGNTSSDLIDVADLFTDIAQVAKVEKGSSRSGRRVADDEADLSMTEVPEKQSEGTGAGRGRGRGRGRARTAEVEAPATRGRAGRAAAPAVPTDGEALVVLPGEKLSRAAARRPVAAAAPVDEDQVPEDATIVPAGDEAGELGELGELGEAGEAGRRRRRRRGGRGRGRGRDRVAAVDADVAGPDEGAEDEEPEAEAAYAPRPARSSHTFGSVWDSQLGVPRAAAAPPERDLNDEEDLDEPPIPEYLIAERRGRDAGRGGRGVRGRSGYSAAVERERFGGRSGGGRLPEPSGRGGAPRGDRGGFPRDDRGPRPAPIRRGSSDEPWSDVPPELEAMIKAQLAAKLAGPAPKASAAPARASTSTAEAGETAEAPKTARRSRTAKPAAERAEPAAEATEAAPKRSTRSRTTKASATTATAEAGETAEAPKAARRSRTAKPATERAEPAAKATEAAPKRATRSRTTKASATTATAEAGETAEAPKRRTRRGASASD